MNDQFIKKKKTSVVELSLIFSWIVVIFMKISQDMYVRICGVNDRIVLWKWFMIQRILQQITLSLFALFIDTVSLFYEWNWWMDVFVWQDDWKYTERFVCITHPLKQRKIIVSFKTLQARITEITLFWLKPLYSLSFFLFSFLVHH